MTVWSRKLFSIPSQMSHLILETYKIFLTTCFRLQKTIKYFKLIALFASHVLFYLRNVHLLMYPNINLFCSLMMLEKFSQRAISKIVWTIPINVRTTQYLYFIRKWFVWDCQFKNHFCEQEMKQDISWYIHRTLLMRFVIK